MSVVLNRMSQRTQRQTQSNQPPMVNSTNSATSESRSEPKYNKSTKEESALYFEQFNKDFAKAGKENAQAQIIKDEQQRQRDADRQQENAILNRTYLSENREKLQERFPNYDIIVRPGIAFKYYKAGNSFKVLFLEKKNNFSGGGQYISCEVAAESVLLQKSNNRFVLDLSKNSKIQSLISIENNNNTVPGNIILLKEKNSSRQFFGENSLLNKNNYAEAGQFGGRKTRKKKNKKSRKNKSLINKFRT